MTASRAQTLLHASGVIHMLDTITIIHMLDVSRETVYIDAMTMTLASPLDVMPSRLVMGRGVFPMYMLDRHVSRPSVGLTQTVLVSCCGDPGPQHTRKRRDPAWRAAKRWKREN